jgi:hypothetical protein
MTPATPMMAYGIQALRLPYRACGCLPLWRYSIDAAPSQQRSFEVLLVRVRPFYHPLLLQRFALYSIVVLCFTGCAVLGVGRQQPAPVAVPEVVQMSKEGLPVETILQKMRDSGTIYRLTASQLVRLHEDGVPEAVLDYMQETYLAAVRRDQVIEDWRHWAFAADGYWYGGRPYGWPRLWW